MTFFKAFNLTVATLFGGYIGAKSYTKAITCLYKNEVGRSVADERYIEPVKVEPVKKIVEIKKEEPKVVVPKEVKKAPKPAKKSQPSRNRMTFPYRKIGGENLWKFRGCFDKVKDKC